MLMERLADKAARLTGIDPVDIRRRNLVASDAFPWRTPTGERLDSGDYVRLLDKASERAGYDLQVLRDDVRLPELVLPFIPSLVVTAGKARKSVSCATVGLLQQRVRARRGRGGSLPTGRSLPMRCDRNHKPF